MAELYITDNTDGASQTFYKRLIYNYDAIYNINEFKNLTDFNFGEKFLYGRVNGSFMPMYLEKFSTARLTPLQPAAGTNESTAQQSAINFVVDAFEDLSQVFDKAVAKGDLSADHEYLSKLKVYKSFESPIELFNDHQDSYTSAVQNHFVANNIHVKDFNEFIGHLKPLLMQSVKQHPFTFSAFLKSKYCPISVSGLAIEIADLDYFNDSQKIENFIRSRHWEYFLNACRSFGFMVDKNIPWRIVADIGSNEMLEYARAYRLNTTNRILNIGYSRSDYIYFSKFRRYLLKLYDLVKLPQFTVVEDCGSSLIRRNIVPKSYSEDSLSLVFPERDLIGLLFEIRMHEEPKEFSDAEKKRILRDCLGIFDRVGASRASIAFERTINHPFDYRGSLSYNVNRKLKGHGDKIVLSKSRR